MQVPSAVRGVPEDFLHGSFIFQKTHQGRVIMSPMGAVMDGRFDQEEGSNREEHGQPFP